jgi:hypothetical protein
VERRAWQEAAGNRKKWSVFPFWLSSLLSPLRSTHSLLLSGSLAQGVNWREKVESGKENGKETGERRAWQEAAGNRKKRAVFPFWLSSLLSPRRSTHSLLLSQSLAQGVNWRERVERRE